MEKKKLTCVYIYLFTLWECRFEINNKIIFKLFLLIIFFTIISIKTLGQEKNPYFTQPFFSLYSFFSANLSGFSFDFWHKALEIKNIY